MRTIIPVEILGFVAQARSYPMLSRTCSPPGSSPLQRAFEIFLSDGRECLPHLIELVPNAVDEEIFRPCTEEKKREARNNLGLPQDVFLSGCIGRLAREKNFILLPGLAALHPDIMFVIAGSGTEGAAGVSRWLRSFGSSRGSA